MFGNERNMGVSFGTIIVIILLAATAASCVPLTDPVWLVGPSPLSPLMVTMTPEAQADVAAPSPITHHLAKREECLDCHDAEDGHEPAPADHSDLAEAVCMFCHMPEEGETAVPPLPAEAETDFCLGCHGPFEELEARTAAAITVNDIESNPHMYVPHRSTNIFSCKLCHGVHLLPVNSAVEIPQATQEYCFEACHHTEDFRPCDKCHDEDE